MNHRLAVALLAFTVACVGSFKPAPLTEPMDARFVTIAPDSFDVNMVTTKGPMIEKHPDFPSRVNVEFVQILSRSHVKQRTWERGSGETFACGSGACAVGFTLATQGLAESSVRVDLLGGTLQIEVAQDGRVRMTGPAVEVFSGEWPTKAPRRR